MRSYDTAGTVVPTGCMQDRMRRGLVPFVGGHSAIPGINCMTCEATQALPHHCVHDCRKLMIVHLLVFYGPFSEAAAAGGEAPRCWNSRNGSSGTDSIGETHEPAREAGDTERQRDAEGESWRERGGAGELGWRAGYGRVAVVLGALGAQDREKERERERERERDGEREREIRQDSCLCVRRERDACKTNQEG